MGVSDGVGDAVGLSVGVTVTVMVAPESPPPTATGEVSPPSLHATKVNSMTDIATKVKRLGNPVLRINESS